MRTEKYRPDAKNPNQLDTEQCERIAESMEKFGDLSGIVLNRRTGLIVGGHLLFPFADAILARQEFQREKFV